MRVLIAEDESIIRLGLKRMLEEMGHTVVEARNGREAIQFVARFTPDIAILDIEMPFTTGIEAAKVIQRESPLPIIFLTAYGEPSIVEKATDLPVQGYLIKPFDPASLSAAMTLAVKRFQESAELTARVQASKQALEDRKVIEKAKGKLMSAGLEEEAALSALRKHARDNRITLPDAARAVLRMDF